MGESSREKNLVIWPASMLLLFVICEAHGDMCCDIGLYTYWLIYCFASAAPRPHHPRGRPGHRDEAREHLGVRQTGDSPGTRGRHVRLLRPSRHVDSSRSETLHSWRTALDFFKVFSTLPRDSATAWWRRDRATITRSFFRSRNLFNSEM